MARMRRGRRKKEGNNMGGGGREIKWGGRRGRRGIK